MNVAWVLVSAALAPSLVVAGSPGGASLSAAAAASGRPRECMSTHRRALAKGPSVWEAARVPTLQAYCDLLARASAQLASSPDTARKWAGQADQALPGRAAPAVLLARAALSLGSVADAAKEFERARSIDPRSVEDPSTMHDLARVLVKTGKREEALAVYRALVPRIDLLGTTDRRVAVLLEAAHVSMALVEVGPQAAPRPVADRKARLDEPVAYLREARQRQAGALSGDVLLSLVLVLDRAGEGEDADAALADAQRTGAHLRADGADYLAAPDDRLALDALALEGTSQLSAAKGWEAFLASSGGKGPWAAAARARLEALRKGGAARAGRRDAAPAGRPRRSP